MCNCLTNVTQNHFHLQCAFISKVNCPNTSLMETFIEDGMIYFISDPKIFSMGVNAGNFKYNKKIKSHFYQCV